ncbi:MAG: acetoacetyl-CoA reductase [Betaproteobacteria bacterium]|nr:acetoacetyl-CoA reductase [Betaproteobacteria bacterium]MDE2122404.1 acetoacetyl-CoA reductase [Betaproteobacteria bacterium]MDE2186256.1 acetoacetyl-CoA reductase [Betaproteobacteria bacterium]MDE2325298.1 acetoacetyl-CoA reductase [Betaproteobacteria bacterium]
MTRLALITGGTRGIGAAIARRLQQDGCRIVVTYRGNEVAARAFRDATAIAAYPWDASDPDACAAGVQQVETDFAQGVDILVNNAGITRDASLHNMTPAQWRAVIDADLDACFNMSRAVIAGMRGRGWGRIINITSINGQKGQFGQTNYAAAKAGVIGFSKALALESARKGITVNTVAPGYTATDMVAAVATEVLRSIVAQIPLGRLAQPEEIAHAVAFLAHEQSGFITGSTLSINGGQYLA